MELRRHLADEIRRYREDAGLSQLRVANAAGVSQSVLSELEAGKGDPGVEVLARIGAALGGRLTVRIDPGTGSPIRDHIQAAIGECVLGLASAQWRRLLEVAVYQPVRGVIDLVLHDPDQHVIVATEIQSELRRLEQQMRWLHAKADALAVGGCSPDIAAALDLGGPTPRDRVAPPHPEVDRGDSATSFPRIDRPSLARTQQGMRTPSTR